jgi:PAS domain S-box-containing protein
MPAVTRLSLLLVPMLRELRLHAHRLMRDRWRRPARPGGEPGLAGPAGPGELEALRRQLHEAQRSEQRWRAVFEHAPQGMALADDGGRIIAANPALQALLGCGGHALGHGALLEIVHPGDQPALAAALRPAGVEMQAGMHPPGPQAGMHPPGPQAGMHAPGPQAGMHAPGPQAGMHASGPQAGCDLRCRRADGSEFPARITVSPVPATRPQGAVAGGGTLLCTVEDRSEPYRSQAQADRLAALVEHSPDFIGIADMQGEVLFVNAAGRRMMGVDGDRPGGAGHVLDYIAEEDHVQYRQAILPALHSAGLWEGETRFRHFRTGALVPMWNHAFVVRDPQDGQPAGLATISRNLADRGRAQAELMALKDELAAELRAMRRLHELSTRLLASDGLQPLLEEILTCTIALQGADFGTVQMYNRDSGVLDMVAHRNYPPGFAAHFAQVRDGSTPCGQAMLQRSRVVVEDLRADDWYAPLLPLCDPMGMRGAMSTPLFSRGGELLGVLSTQFRQPHRPSEHELRVADLLSRQAAQLIERKRVEAALQRSEAYLAAAERLTHTGSWAWSAGPGGELYWSDEMFALFGRDPAHWKPSYEEAYASLHPDDRARVREAFEQAVQRRREFQCEYRIVLPDGSVRHVRALSHPVLDAQGNLVEYLGSLSDVTERKRSEAALAQAHEELAHLTRVMSMGELVASVAHEVNQPLAAIVINGNACLRWLARDTPNLYEARTAVERIVRDGIRAGEVVDRVRAFVRKTPPQMTWLDMNHVVRQALALASTELQRHKLALRVELASGLPPVRGDRIQLQQVVLNLMMNGIEAMQDIDGRPRELVIRSCSTPADQVVVAVQDSGVGLDQVAVERLFDAFFTTKCDGMGLGLALSRRIVEAHGGRVWAVRNDDCGATVSFSIPSQS